MDRGLTIGSGHYGKNHVLVIAEVGTGHGGDLEKAKRLVDAAADAGADCVKLQMVYADEILHPNTGVVPLPGGDIRLYDRFRSLELPVAFFAAIKAYAERRGLLFLCTPFGPRSARELQSLGVAAIKIASPELNYIQLLDEVSGYGLPLILSSGVSRLSDIENALERCEAQRTASQLALLHCVTAYPAPEEDYNLRSLESLSAVFGIPVGVSDHSLDPVLVPTLAAALGAFAVEKHICLSRADPGLDDPIALDPADFTHMTASIRRAETEEREQTIQRIAAAYGFPKVAAVLGSGIKSLAPSEEANYERTNRSIHVLADIEAGDMLTADTLACLRTEKVLRPGLPPAFLPSLIGRRARRRIPAGEGLLLDDI